MREAVDARWLAALVLVLAATHAARAAVPVVELSGEAFGTRWQVRVVPEAGAAGPERLAAAIDAVLRTVDARMSTWREDSELSRFNASRETDWQPVSAATARVLEEALRIHRLSEGAFDPTVAPLVEAWGFGPAPARLAPPSDEILREARFRVDAASLAVRASPPALRKTRPDLRVDVSGAAKGFAVDEVARALERLGARRFLVEIGGELRARGAGPAGGPWPVGIERPHDGPVEVGWRVGLADAALATSGAHRQAFRWRGRRFSHVLDPRTGRPVTHALVSVSVLSREALAADAWATALLVLGPEAGWRVAEREGLAVLFVIAGDAGLEVRATPDLERHRLP